MKIVKTVLQNAFSIKCQYCGVWASNQTGYATRDIDKGPSFIDYVCGSDGHTMFMTLLCPRCGFWNIYKGGLNDILPVKKYDHEINNLNGEILSLFNNIKKQANNGDWRVVILLSRILIMHISINHGAEKNKTFQDYVKYLENNNLVNRDLSKLIDSIRIMGNELNHEIDSYKSEYDEKINNEGKIIYSVVVDALEHLYKYKHLSVDSK